MTALAPFLAGRTTIVISHRPAVAQQADDVIELRRGRISQSPTPAAGGRRVGSQAVGATGSG